MKDLLQRLSASIQTLQEYEGEDSLKILQLESEVSKYAMAIISASRDMVHGKMPLEDTCNEPLDDDSEDRKFDPTHS